MNEYQIITLKRPLVLESGQQLSAVEVGYTAIGNPQNPVVWICHALTANADPVAWWPGLVGPGKLFDPQEHYIVCANILGSCYGTTGPQSIDPATGEPWLQRFPAITIRDMVQVHEQLRLQLGIGRLHTLVGGSMGGQQALEWAIESPEVTERLVLLATHAKQSPWGIAFHEAQRLALQADPSFAAGSDDAGKEGLRAARAIALLGYRNYQAFQLTQQDAGPEVKANYRAATYLRYQGEQLANRFNAHAYYTLSRAMDSHHVGRGRQGIANALQRVAARTLVIGIASDILCPLTEQEFLAEYIPDAALAVVESLYGHDGFLIEQDQLRQHIANFLYRDALPYRPIRWREPQVAQLASIH
ncbi:MAG: homoserine O-acetyltransferase [Bacteroidota bacterium]